MRVLQNWPNLNTFHVPTPKYVLIILASIIFHGVFCLFLGTRLGVESLQKKNQKNHPSIRLQGVATFFLYRILFPLIPQYRPQFYLTAGRYTVPYSTVHYH